MTKAIENKFFIILNEYVIKTIICIEIYFKIIIVNFALFVRISTRKF